MKRREERRGRGGWNKYERRGKGERKREDREERMG